MDMILQLPTGELDVPGHCALCDLAVFDAHIPVSRGRAQEGATVTIVQVQHHPAEAQQDRDSASCYQCQVKLTMEGLPTLQRLRNRPHRDLFCSADEAPSSHRFPSRCSRPPWPGVGRSFEFLTQPRDLLEVRQGDRSDTIAAVVLELDQAVGDQAGQRLPKGTQADSEAFPHPMQVDLASGLELPGDDSLPQPIDELARDRILIVIDQRERLPKGLGVPGPPFGAS